MAFSHFHGVALNNSGFIVKVILVDKICCIIFWKDSPCELPVVLRHPALA